MSMRIRKLALYLLVVLLPLQCVASAVQALTCDNASQRSTAGGSHHHGHDDGNHSHDGPSDDTGLAAHDGCHHSSPGAVPGLRSIASAKPRVFEPAPAAHYQSFFPEHRKRPPLAPAA